MKHHQWAFANVYPRVNLCCSNHDRKLLQLLSSDEEIFWTYICNIFIVHQLGKQVLASYINHAWWLLPGNNQYLCRKSGMWKVQMSLTPGDSNHGPSGRESGGLPLDHKSYTYIFFFCTNFFIILFFFLSDFRSSIWWPLWAPRHTFCYWSKEWFCRCRPNRVNSNCNIRVWLLI